MKKKVLFIHSVKEYGGGAKYTLDLINNLDKNRFEFSVAIPFKSEIYSFFKSAAVHLIDFSVQSRLDLKNMFSFCRNIKKNNFYLILTGDSISWYTGSIARMFNKELKTIAIIHISTLGSGKRFGFVKRKIIFLIDKLWTHFYDRIIFSSRYHFELMKSENSKNNKMILVYDWVDVDFIEKKISNFDYSEIFKKYYFLKKDIINIGMVARFGPGKDYKTVVDAVPHVISKNPDVCFVLVGDGPDFVLIKEYINRLNLNNYIYLTGGEFQYYYQLLNFFDIVLYSSYADGIPFTILDTLALKKPLIVSDCNAMREIISDGKTGLLFKPGSAKDLAKKIDVFLKNDRIKKECGKNGYSLVKKKFNKDILISKIQEIICDVLNKYSLK